MRKTQRNSKSWQRKCCSVKVPKFFKASESVRSDLDATQAQIQLFAIDPLSFDSRIGRADFDTKCSEQFGLTRYELIQCLRPSSFVCERNENFGFLDCATS